MMSALSVWTLNIYGISKILLWKKRYWTLLYLVSESVPVVWGFKNLMNNIQIVRYIIQSYISPGYKTASWHLIRRSKKMHRDTLNESQYWENNAVWIIRCAKKNKKKYNVRLDSMQKYIWISPSSASPSNDTSEHLIPNVHTLQMLHRD